MTSASFDLSTVFRTVATTLPGAQALAWRDQRLTYGQMDSRIDGIAHYLTAQGLGCHTERDQLETHQCGQDTVGLYLRNGNQYLEAMHRCSALHGFPGLLGCRGEGGSAVSGTSYDCRFFADLGAQFVEVTILVFAAEQRGAGEQFVVGLHSRPSAQMSVEGPQQRVLAASGHREVRGAIDDDVVEDDHRIRVGGGTDTQTARSPPRHHTVVAHCDAAVPGSAGGAAFEVSGLRFTRRSGAHRPGLALRADAPVSAGRGAQRRQLALANSRGIKPGL